MNATASSAVEHLLAFQILGPSYGPSSRALRSTSGIAPPSGRSRKPLYPIWGTEGESLPLRIAEPIVEQANDSGPLEPSRKPHGFSRP